MSKIVKIVFLSFVTFKAIAQTGPGGIGNDIGTSSLKIWYNADIGVFSTSNNVYQWSNNVALTDLDLFVETPSGPVVNVGVVNGHNELSFNGSNRLSTSSNVLTSSNFVGDATSTFLVSRADYNYQYSVVYATDPTGYNRFSCHVPWANNTVFDIGTCCSNDARIQLWNLPVVNNYSIWSFMASPLEGKDLFRNNGLLYSSPNSSQFNEYSTHKFSVGGSTTSSGQFAGDIAELIIFNQRINNTERILVNNYLSSKFNIAIVNDVYNQDELAQGNFDNDVAGIGRISISDFHNNSRGTGMVHVLNPTDLNDNEFLVWGANNGSFQASVFSDLPAGVMARMGGLWRISERQLAINSPVSVGMISMRFDLNGLGSVTASDLRLLIDQNNNGIFSDDLPISGAVSLGSGIFEFQNIPAGTGNSRNNKRFTLGTANNIQTPLIDEVFLNVELIDFSAIPLQDTHAVRLNWKTQSETDSDLFTVERSKEGDIWEQVNNVLAAGYSSSLISYSVLDDSPYNGLSYYRLKQTDIDGKEEFSSVLSVELENLNSSIIYPNPSNNHLIIALDKKEDFPIKIVNINGQDVTDLICYKEVTETSFEIDVSLLSLGVYFLKTSTGQYKFYKN